MSECVVRMEMPTSCEECPACDYEEGNCLLADDRNTLPHNGKRREWCPITCQLPEGHGRLVNADALKEWFIEQIDYYKRFDGPNCSTMVSAYEAVCRVINDAPTIVPAERSET